MPARRGDAARRRLTAAVADAGAMPALQPGGGSHAVRPGKLRSGCVCLEQGGFGLRPSAASWVRVATLWSILGSGSVRLQHPGLALRPFAAIRGVSSLTRSDSGTFFHPSRSARVRLPSIHAGKNNVGSCFIHLEAKNGPRWTEHEPDFCKWTKVEPALPACSTRCMQAGPLYAGSPRCMHIKITDNKRSNYAPKSIVRPILPWWSWRSFGRTPRHLDL